MTAIKKESDYLTIIGRTPAPTNPPPPQPTARTSTSLRRKGSFTIGPFIPQEDLYQNQSSQHEDDRVNKTGGQFQSRTSASQPTTPATQGINSFFISFPKTNENVTCPPQEVSVRKKIPRLTTPPANVSTTFSFVQNPSSTTPSRPKMGSASLLLNRNETFSKGKARPFIQALESTSSSDDTPSRLEASGGQEVATGPLIDLSESNIPTRSSGRKSKKSRRQEDAAENFYADLVNVDETDGTGRTSLMLEEEMDFVSSPPPSYREVIEGEYDSPERGSRNDLNRVTRKGTI